MNVKFENLEKIDEILILIKTIQKIQNSEKRWMSTEETASYLGYSKDSIDSLVKSSEFEKGIHYHQKMRKRLFDKFAIDKWVTESSVPINKVNSIVNDIISSISA